VDELTNEKREALLRLIEATMQEPKYPLSPEVEALRAIADKLHGDERQKPAPRLSPEREFLVMGAHLAESRHSLLGHFQCSADHSFKLIRRLTSAQLPQAQVQSGD